MTPFSELMEVSNLEDLKIILQMWGIINIKSKFYG